MKLLYITHLSGKRVNRFWMTSITAIHKLGGEFHLACNMANADKKKFFKECREYGIVTHQIDFERNPTNLKNIRAYYQLKELLKKEKFEIVHCNTPIGGVLGRIAAKKINGVHLIYQAHGFHFWKGASTKNWLCYYPIERYLSKCTDTLITINQEDYKLSKSFKAKNIRYVHGVGIKLDFFKNNEMIRKSKRQELKLTEEDIAILSVGELISRKNHKVVIDAINSLRDVTDFEHMHYFICGIGELYDELVAYVERLNLKNNVHILGYRVDIEQIYNAADIFVFMSYQEGLPVALMEAMASSNAVICSNIRGNKDLIENNKNGMIIDINCRKLSEAIKILMYDCLKRKELGKNAREKITEFSYEIVENELVEIYEKAIKENDK